MFLGWVLFTVVLGIVVLSAVATANGYRMVLVSSGSMEPAYPVGDGVLIKHVPSEEIRPGDAIVFRHRMKMIMHRVVDLRHVKGKLFYMTKGDANAFTDADLAAAGSLVGRVDYRVPEGRYIQHLSGWPVKVTLVALAVLTLVQEAVAVAPALRRRLTARRAATTWLARKQPSSDYLCRGQGHVRIGVARGRHIGGDGRSLNSRDE